MSKQAVTPLKPMNYPDVLGFLTHGQRLIIDPLHVAVAARPGSVSAGKSFEAIVVLQNALGVELDAVLRLVVPDKDRDGKAGRFSSPVKAAVRIGLRPGEVGYATMPILVTHQTAPADYAAQVEVTVESQGRAGARVRGADGGAYFNLNELESERHPIYEAVMGLNFVTDAQNRAATKAMMGIPFTVRPAAIAGLPEEFRAGYTTLWTDADFSDAEVLSQQAKKYTDALLPKLNRQAVFFPLMRKTAEQFEASGYRLWAGEAVLIAKLLTLMVEMGAPITVAGQVQPIYPRWFGKLCRLLLRRPSIVTPEQVAPYLADQFYADLLHDAAVFGFTMLGTVTNEDFGTADEMASYAQRLQNAVMAATVPLDLGRVWLPLVLGGLVASQRIAMPHEVARETVELFVRARERRARERAEHNAFLFQMADDLIERALEVVGRKMD